MLLQGKIYGLPGSDGTVRILIGGPFDTTLGLRVSGACLALLQANFYCIYIATIKP